MSMEAKTIITALNRWYVRHKRDLPWRASVTPYRVWLSEIMLQQTTVPAVIPYFAKFTEDYPTVDAMATAPLDDIMRDWAGLGYYSRARNLHACAQVVANTHGGTFPSDIAGLKALPGIGDYTAGAIRAIAFNKKASVVDGNVDRVISRLYAIETPLPASKPEIRARADTIYMDAANTKPADLPQAFMDLGATICTPQKPKCMSCPLSEVCEAKANGLQDELPRKTRAKDRPKRTGWVYWVTDVKGRTLLHRRPAKGLLGGMAGLPTSDWSDVLPAHEAIYDIVRVEKETVRHVFTHFELTLHVVHARIVDKAPDGFYWAKLDDAGLPSVFAKVVKLLQAA